MLSTCLIRGAHAEATVSGEVGSMRCSSYQRFCRAVHAGEIVSHVQVTLEPGSSLSNWPDIGTDGQRS